MIAVAAETAAVAALLLIIGAAVIDIVRFEIPDYISISVATLALVFAILEPREAWWSYLAAPLLMFGFGLLAFSRGWLGGGDVKLMTAIAGWTGLGGLPLMFVATSIAGGGLALAKLLARRIAAGQDRRVGSAVRAATPLPYAVAIAIGTLWWLWATGGGPLAGHYAIGAQRLVARAIAT